MTFLRAFAACYLLAANSPVFACMVKPAPMSMRQLDRISDVVVKGVFRVTPESYPGTNVKFAAGSLVGTYLIKGRKVGTYRISQKGVDLACQSWGWQPPNINRGARYTGKFWLLLQSDGTYAIAKFLQYPSL
jgi:hypothetical protein